MARPGRLRRPSRGERALAAVRSAHRSPWPLAAFFALAGTLHFVRPDFYLRIMPPYLPRPREIVYLSGVAEIAGGVGALIPATRPAARWGLIALLVAVFPANLHATLHPQQVGIESGTGRVLLWARLPLQALFVAWVLAATRDS